MNAELYFAASKAACMRCPADAELDSELCASCKAEANERIQAAHERHVRNSLSAWLDANPDRSYFRRSTGDGCAVSLVDYSTGLDVESTKPTEIEALSNALQAVQSAEVAA